METENKIKKMLIAFTAWLLSLVILAVVLLGNNEDFLR